MHSASLTTRAEIYRRNVFRDKKKRKKRRRKEKKRKKNGGKKREMERKQRNDLAGSVAAHSSFPKFPFLSSY